MNCTRYSFKVGSLELGIVDRYRYLGLYLHEFLDFGITADYVAKAASRALGVLIAKSKALGGMPFKCFKKLYETMVLPVIHYGSAIWGHSQFSCINGVHIKACQYFLGVGKYTPNAAVQGDVGIFPPIVDQWIIIIRSWCNMVNMASHRLNRKIMVWSWQYAVNGNCKNLTWKVWGYYKKNNLSDQRFISNYVSTWESKIWFHLILAVLK